MGFFYKYIRRFFPPLVVGCTLVTIGVRGDKQGGKAHNGGGLEGQLELHGQGQAKPGRVCNGGGVHHAQNSARTRALWL